MCARECRGSQKPTEEGVRFPAAGVTGDYEPPECGCWEQYLL